MSNDNKINLSAPTLATFKAGDAVRCPSLSLSPFVLTNDPYGKRDVLALEYESSYFYYDRNGYFVRANQNETDDFQPSLFADTPANRQAIATLYSGSHTSQRKTIDTTAPNDDEVIILPSHELSHIACDIQGAITVLNDIGQLLALIHYDKIDRHTAQSMARLAHDATCTWSNLLLDQLGSINETLAMTRYGREGSK